MIILHSLFILIGIALIVLAPITSELRPLIGGVVILAIGAWNLAKRLRKQTTIKRTDAEQVLEQIKRGKKIKL
jgi:putative Mn2+ efflux pump MntP